MIDLKLGPLIVLAFIGVSFGLWKLVELIVWVFQHLHWT
jgi:hypothetical protein